MIPKLPALFLSHGSPMVALSTAENDPYVAALAKLAAQFPKPRAILAISAHWYTRGKFVDVSERPQTIYDFHGFPKALSEVQYPCPGFPEITDLLDQVFTKGAWKPVTRGLDHGVWSILKHVYPNADVPVASLSVDSLLSPEEHFALGKKLSALRREGILIVATGNFVHDLSSIDFSDETGQSHPFARDFDTAIKKTVESGDFTVLFRPETLPGGMRSVPTPDHYLPALTVLATAAEGESVKWLYEGFELKSISRRAFAVGL